MTIPAIVSLAGDTMMLLGVVLAVIIGLDVLRFVYRTLTSPDADPEAVTE